MNSESFFRLWFLSLLLFLGNFQASQAESIATITYPEVSVTDPNGVERISIEALAELSNITFGETKVSELSDLAWDKDENLLYALSDNAQLITFKPVFEPVENGEKLIDIQFVHGVLLHDSNGKKLRWKPSDSEGMTLINANNGIKGDTEFIVSFERIPRVIRYNQQGMIEETYKIPSMLSDIKNYKKENKSLEAVVMHEELGMLLGSEYALDWEDRSLLSIYDMRGNTRTFPAHFKDGALTALTVNDDQSLLALERIYGGVFSGFKVAIHHLQLKEDSMELENEVIAEFLPSEGFFNDNFEGLEQHKENYYFMISDDNNHPAKRTVLVYFRYTNIDRH